MSDDAGYTPGGLNPDHDPEAFGGLNPTGSVVCGRCGMVIVYDPTRSWWLDATGIPSCAPGPNGEFLEHDPQDSAWMTAALAGADRDELDVLPDSPMDDPEEPES